MIGNNENYTEVMHTLVRRSTEKFPNAYCREDLLELHQAMVAAKGRSSHASRRADLLEALSACGLRCGRDACDEALLEKIWQVGDRAAIELELLQELQRISTEFPSAEHMMTRLVRRLADPDFREDPVRLAIVKQFLKYTDYHTGPIKTLAQKKYGLTAAESKNLPTLLGALDEGIFDILEEIKTMDKQKQRDARRSYALLKLAEDLAHGWFRTNGKTKTDLYMFAFAFGMTVYTGVAGDVFDPERDVEKNLFRDYYQDNLLRYITAAYAQSPNSYEAEPSGEGINYKNFAEVIYLYYLRRPELSAREKIRRAEKMIDRCAAAAAGDVLPDTDMLITDDYRVLFADEIWHLDEEELAAYLPAHFEIPASKAKSYITAQWGQYAAVNNYLERLDELDISDGMETDYNGVELFSEEILARAELTDDFRRLLRKMEQMLRLYMPRPATALAYALQQEGEEETAQRLLDLAAGLEALLEDLSGKHLEMPLKQYTRLKELRQSAAEKEAKLPKTDSQLAAEASCRELKALREAHKAAFRAANQLMENFRERTQELRATYTEQHFWTVEGNLKAMKEPLQALVNQARRCESKLPALYAAAGVSVKPDWCGGYIRLVEQMIASLPMLERRAEAVYAGGKRTALTEAELAQRKEYEKDLEHLERIGRTAIVSVVYHNMISGQTERMSMPALYKAFCREADPVLEASRYQTISEKNLFDMFTLFELYHSLTLER